MDLSLYFHVPFCSRKCGYCTFYSESCGAAGNDEQTLYVRRLLEETEKELVRLNPCSVPTVYIGGGTPSSLSIKNWKHLLSGISSLLRRRGLEWSEWTVEGNPESLTAEKLSVAADAGVNRLSVGIQSFQSKTLTLLERGASKEQNVRTLELIKENWPGSWNADLICEIPGQTRESALSDWNMLSSFEPPHVSLYTLSIEEGTPLALKTEKGEIPEMADEDIWPLLTKTLEQSGYRRYEVSNYHRRDLSPCEHNMRYWRMRPYLGLGPGAVSTIPGERGPVRRENLPDIRSYLSDCPGKEEEILSPPDFLKEYLLMGLRTVEGIDLQEINRIFGVALNQILPRWLEDQRNGGNILIKEDFLKVTVKGELFLNDLLTRAFSEMDGTYGLLGPVCQWP